MFRCAFLILTLAIGGSSANTSCPDTWMPFHGSCYLSYHGVYNYHDAEAKCKALGGYLVHIETSTENTFIKSFLAELKADKHWIGLEDPLMANIWKWHGTNNIASFTNWGVGQPKGGTGSTCVVILASFGYNWVDEPCTNRLFRPLCEQR